LDGRSSFCYGVDEQWLPNVPLVSGTTNGDEDSMTYTQTERHGEGRPRAHSGPDSMNNRIKTTASDVGPSTALECGYSADTLHRRKRLTESSATPHRLVRDKHLLPPRERSTMRRHSLGTLPSRTQTDEAHNLSKATSFFKMNDDEKRASFLKTMDWSLFDDLVKHAGCVDCEERVEALLCLTAFHDIMKVEALLPTVQPEHAPYCGYDAGVRILDHDVALGYIMEYFPSLLPSYRGLSSEGQKAVLFTQGKMQFNHGWFVQAEAPPGAMLSGFKAALRAGAAPRDMALYFLHWTTDLAGAEATPLGGAEKFVLKFPHAVLSSFMWSIPYLRRLQTHNETEVVEMYLAARWNVLAPSISMPSPVEEGNIACVRLAVMAQSDLRVVDAFKALEDEHRGCLATELARTGCRGQRFAGADPVNGGGPALLVYYGPALLQKHRGGSFEELCTALCAFAQVLQAARRLWPLKEEEEGTTVTIQIGVLKAATLEDIVTAPAGDKRQVWVLRQHNLLEGSVELVRASGLQELHDDGASFHVLDFGKATKQ